MGEIWPRHLEGPPADLARRSLPIVEVASLWFRCHRRLRAAVHFGRGEIGRFNDPDGEFGVLYAGLDPRAAFIEVFGDYFTLDGDDLRERVMSSLVADRSSRLVDLTGGHLARLSLDARIATDDHRMSQRWAGTLQRHPDRPDGILYRCRHDPSQLAVAVFESAELGIEASRLGDTTLTALAASYGLAVE